MKKISLIFIGIITGIALTAGFGMVQKASAFCSVGSNNFLECMQEERDRQNQLEEMRRQTRSLESIERRRDNC